jgi:hypothetical protein
MSTRFYIAGMEIEQPNGLNGFYMERLRDKVFGGFIRQRTSSVKGIGQVQIREPKVCNLLAVVFDKYGIDGVTDFKIIQHEKAIFIAEVDYGQYSVNEKGFANISFRDTGGVVEFDVNVEKEYEIQPLSKIYLEKTKLTGKATHTLDENLKVLSVSVVQNNPRRFYLSVPLKVSKKDSVTNGVGLDVNDISGVQQPFWRNTDTKPVSVTVGGYLEFSSKCSDNDTVRVYLLNRTNGDVRKTVELDSYANGVVLTTRKIVIDKTVEVGVGGDLVLFIEGQNDIQNYQINFVTADLAIEQDLEIRGTFVRGMFSGELMSKLIDMVSEGKYTYNDQTDFGKKLFITNGFNLRANSTNLKVVMMKVFMALDKMFGLSLSIEGSTVTIRQNKDEYALSGVYDFKNENSVVISSTSDLYVSEIKVGYSEWKSETLLGNLETNSPRTYDTGIKKVKGSADLMVNEMILSGRLIEKVRRLQFDILKNNQSTDDKYDNALFGIWTNGQEAIIGNTGLNEALNPMQVLMNQEVNYGHCRGFYYRTGEGNVTETLLNIKQNKDFEETKGYFTGRKVMVSGTGTLKDYISFGNIARVKYGGGYVRFWIMNDTYRIQTNAYTVDGYEISEK